METDSEKHFQTFLNLINRVAKIAGGLKIAAVVLLIPTLICYLLGIIYFYSATDLGHWRWGIPTAIMMAPILCLGIVWYVLDSITALPEVCVEQTANFKSMVKHHRKEIALAEGARLSKFKYLTLVGKMLYGSTEVIDGVGMASFAASPFFWIFYTISFIGSILMSTVMLITCGYLYFFT